MVVILNHSPSIANEFLRDVRDVATQQNRQLFRHSVERLGELMAYEISKKLGYQTSVVQTPLGKAFVEVLGDQPVLITVLRAGIPYFTGFQRHFQQADCGFIGAYREETLDESEKDIFIHMDYVATPSLEGRTVILIDPMLATGKSFVKTVKAITKNGQPSYIHIASLVASPEGVALLEKELQIPHTIWTWSLDEKLNDQFYIVPGLGDAGDLSFGEKK